MPRGSSGAGFDTIGALFDIVNVASKAVSGTALSGRTRRSIEPGGFRNLDPAFTESKIGFARSNGTKAFIVRGLMWVYALKKAAGP
jgi:hypothetical protein